MGKAPQRSCNSSFLNDPFSPVSSLKGKALPEKYLPLRHTHHLLSGASLRIRSVNTPADLRRLAHRLTKSECDLGNRSPSSGASVQQHKQTARPVDRELVGDGLCPTLESLQPALPEIRPLRYSESSEWFFFLSVLNNKLIVLHFQKSVSSAFYFFSLPKENLERKTSSFLENPGLFLPSLRPW